MWTAELPCMQELSTAPPTLAPRRCGQTNVWILPEGDYGAFAAGPDEVYICAPRAARNMGFQDIFEKNVLASPKQLMSIKGSQLIGAKCKAPLTPYEHVYMLPLTTISMTKGTAIVTSVPSDSPDDYAAFMDLKNPKKREFYGVQVRGQPEARGALSEGPLMATHCL